MIIGVTGGAGFIGSNLTKRLEGSGHEIVVLDNFVSGKKSNLEGSRAKIIEADLQDKASVAKFVSQVEAVVHLGALGSVPRSIEDPMNSFGSNVIGTLNLLEEVRNKNIHLIFSSSSSVYGRNIKSPKSELEWLTPLSPYAATKLSCEALILSYANSYNLKTLVFRLFNVFGPFQSADHAYAAVIPKWGLAALKNEKIVIYGDGEQSRDFTYVDTVTEVIENALLNKVTSDFPVNLALGRAFSLNSLLHKFQEYFGELTLDYQPPRKGDIRDSLSDPSNLKKLFPKITEIDFDNSLRKTLDWVTETYKTH